MNSDIKKLFQQLDGLDVKTTIQTLGAAKQLSLRDLAKDCGLNPAYFSERTNTRKFRPDLLAALSLRLDANIFNLYTQFLPPALFKTKREAELEKEVAALKQQIRDLENQMAGMERMKR